MAITPADIEQLTFSPSKHGYNTDEVDSFLDQLSGEVDAMLQKIADLKSRLTTTESQLSASQAQVAALEQQLAEASAAAPTPAPAAVATSQSSASESQISRVLIVAQQSADKLVAEARDNAESIRNEADKKAREVIRQALAEKQAELDEIDRLKASREEFRGEYKRLLQQLMDDADPDFPTGVAAAVSSTGTVPATPHVAEPVAPAQDANATILTRSIGSASPVSSVDDFNDLD
jgi:cell division initiation protein